MDPVCCEGFLGDSYKNRTSGQGGGKTTGRYLGGGGRPTATGWGLHGKAGKPCWNQRLHSPRPRRGLRRNAVYQAGGCTGKLENPAGTSACAAQGRGRGGYGKKAGRCTEKRETLLEPAPRPHSAEGGAALRSATLTADRRTGTGWGLHGKAGKPCWNQHLGSTGPRAGRR